MNAAAPTSSVAVATISSANYWPYTAVMVESLRRACPDWKIHVLALTSLPAAAHECGAVVIDAAELWGDETAGCGARFTLFEWACASKPKLLRHLLDRAGAAIAVYADSDLEFFSAPPSLASPGWSVLLQPNVCSLEERESAAWERLHLMYGVYNGGFLAVRDTDSARSFLSWWDEQASRYSCTEPTLDVFSDQRWLDMAPGLFEGVLVDRNPACNVAVWNVRGRKVHVRDGDYFAGGRPMSFFHYHRVRLGIDVPAYVTGLDDPAPIEGLVRSYLERAARHAAAAQGATTIPVQAHPVVHKAVRDALARGELAARDWPARNEMGAHLRGLAFDEPAVRARVRLLAYHWPSARALVDLEGSVARYRGSRLYRGWIDLWFFLFAPRAVPLAREWTFRSAGALAFARASARAFSGLVRRGRAAWRPAGGRT